MVCLDLNFYICIFGFEFLRQNVFQLHDHFSDIKDFRAENILISFSQTVKPHGYCKRNLSVAGFYNLKCCDFVTLTSLISIVHIFLFQTSLTFLFWERAWPSLLYLFQENHLELSTIAVFEKVTTKEKLNRIRTYVKSKD